MISTVYCDVNFTVLFANWVTASFDQFSACSQRPTQLNSSQPVLKMFRTPQTERFQLS